MSDIFEGLNKAVGKVQEFGGKVVEGAKEALDKTDLDEKIVGAAKDLKGKAQEMLDKTDLDEKLVGAARDLKDKAVGLINRSEAAPEAAKAADAVKDVMTQIRDDVAAQVQNIRAAASASNPIHDYMQGKHNPQPAAPAAPAAPAPAADMQAAADQAQAAAEKAAQAAEEVHAALDETAQDISDRAARAFNALSDAEAPKE